MPATSEWVSWDFMRIRMSGRRGRVRAALAAGAGGCLLCGLAIAVPADAATTGPVPSVDCINVAADGTVTAYFGYSSDTSTDIAVGDNNQVFPVDADQGQPTELNPGTYPRVFSVTFNPDIIPTVSWILNGAEADASAESPQCQNAVTAPASDVSATAATFNGVVAHDGTDVTFTFEYGTTPADDSATTPLDAGNGDADLLVQATLTDLSPSTMYNYRLVTTVTAPDGSVVTTEGEQVSFTTPAAPVPPPPPGLALATTALPAGKAGTAYSATLSATGGDQPYTWHASGLPLGLRLDQRTGVISGRPLGWGTRNVTITVTDSATPARESLTEQYTITIAR
jgi:hypothetical protein